MKLSLAILSLPLILALSSCGTGGGGKDRYEYPAAKLSGAKTVKGASLDGRFLILADGSTWNVDWSDAPKVRRWNRGDRVNVILTRGKSFPYVLIKQSNGERVAARYGRKLD